MGRRRTNEDLCLDCGEHTFEMHEYYMLIDEVWELIHDSKRGMLCIGCAEARLGRKLHSGDFFHCYLNESRMAFPKSMRLLDRLRAIPGTST